MQGLNKKSGKETKVMKKSNLNLYLKNSIYKMKNLEQQSEPSQKKEFLNAKAFLLRELIQVSFPK